MTNDARPAQGKSWRDVLPVHPAAELFPLMSPDELRELGEDIKKNGLLTPIVVWSPIEGSEEQYLLDGRNRVAAMEAAGGKATLNGRQYAKYIWRGYGPTTFLYGTAKCGAPGCDPYEYVLSANIHRRHLTAEQKREIIAKVIKAKPEASNRQIAKQVKADDKTVGKVRRELEATADIPQLDKTTGRDGKSRTTKPKEKRRARPADADYPTVEAALDGSADNYERGGESEVAPPEEVKSNILNTIERHKAVARAYKKVLAVSKLDQTSKDEVSAAISALINTWQSVQRALARQAPPAAPIQEAQPEITTAVTDTAAPGPAAPVEIPDLPEFLRRTA
jgi:ParB-like nuclease domain